MQAQQLSNEGFESLAAAATLLLGLIVPAAGKWLHAHNTERLCGALGLCTPRRYTWSNLRTAYDADMACALLARKDVKALHLFGDSYHRHLYVAWF